ncbi:hypothetical protein [Methylobacterium sp. Leaf118]|uniref:hypothetical protein n=1 Tax=Methylobacterium sp. Leaf118 TaxID=2876562 RepID=UPI001E57C6EC|nr:hypothetical protein [Methylobacterium sp. Leaf118]
MTLQKRHDRPLTPAEAVALQTRLRAEVVADRPIDLATVHLLAGVGLSVKNERSRAAVVVAIFPDFRGARAADAVPRYPGPPEFPGGAGAGSNLPDPIHRAYEAAGRF